MFESSKLIEKPWGSFRQFTHNEETTVKILEVNQGEELSLQLHHKRKEQWYVIEGTPSITRGDDVFVAQAGDEIFINVEQKHRIAAPDNYVRILEIAYGNFDEDQDIVRLEDKYDRAYQQSD